MTSKRTMPIDSNQDTAPRMPARRARVAISVLLIAHLTIVIAAPMTLSPGSLLANRIANLAAPYLQACNVSHGYAFFAPDPGPSHLIEYELVFPDGRSEVGRFPDLNHHWPRLRYHRHFMLTDQLAYPGPDPRGPVDDNVEVIDEDPAYADWKRQRDDFLLRIRSYGRHVLKEHNAQEVRLRYIRHLIPSPAAVLDGQRLDAEELYIQLGPTVVVTAEDKS